MDSPKASPRGGAGSRNLTGRDIPYRVVRIVQPEQWVLHHVTNSRVVPYHMIPSRMAAVMAAVRRP